MPKTFSVSLMRPVGSERSTRASSCASRPTHIRERGQGRTSRSRGSPARRGVQSSSGSDRGEELDCSRRPSVPGHEDAPGYGYLLRTTAVYGFEGDGDPEYGLDVADQVRELGLRHGDRNLEALGLQDKGGVLVAMGRIEEGMRLIDEAMVAAVAGELDRIPRAVATATCWQRVTTLPITRGGGVG